MILIRESFVAKPGMASKLARLFKDALRGYPENTKVMTDLVGQFNSVVLETETESIAHFEKRMSEYMADQEMRKKFAGYTEMYIEGRREIFQIID
jgi:hypothetical protein